MMDSNKATASAPNSDKPNCDNDKNKNYTIVSKQTAQNVKDEKVFTLSSSSNIVPYNGTGSGSRLANTSSHDTSSQSNKTTETTAENYKNIPSTSNCSSNKVLSNESIQASVTASSSRSSLNTNNGVDTESQSCLRHRVCMAGSSNTPSTSGTSRADDNIVSKENRKRPSSLKLNRPDNDDDDSSTDTGNDDYSLGSEDGCIYTYRGGEHLADLPSSFFSLDMGLPLDRHLPMPPNYAVAQGAGAREGGSRASSPDMDFLEMDFDPGPSCEVDSGEVSSEGDLDGDLNMQDENDPCVNRVVDDIIRRSIPKYFPPPAQSNPLPANSANVPQGEDVYRLAVPSTSRGIVLSQGDSPDQPVDDGPYVTHVNARGEHLMVRRTMLHGAGTVNMHLSSGDVMPIREIAVTEEEYPEGSVGRRCNFKRTTNDVSATVPPSMYHLSMAKKLIADKQKEDSENQSSDVSTDGSEPGPSSSTSSISCVEPPRCMIWSEREACERQVTQIGTSACGATAIVNVFNALGVPVNVDRINLAVGTRLRANTAPIPRYLLSRAVAGCTAAELATGIHRASDGLVTARFFATYPERVVSLSHWLADWISLGAVPILTQNLQMGCDGEMPDAWHHQMVFGVSPRGIYLSNPAECLRETQLWPRLVSPSTLMVRARDVVARFTNTTDLTPLLHVPDHRFETYNVLGQVVNVIREWCAVSWQENLTRTQYIRIPAAYQAGITIAALTGSEAHRRLVVASQLPILHPQNDPA